MRHPARGISMIRREFLSRVVSAAVASLFTREAFAQTMSHSGTDMAGMSASTNALASPDALPSGAPLAALTKLTNTSREPGIFRATLVAQPVNKPLLTGQSDTVFWHYVDGNSAAAHADAPVTGPLIDVHEGDTVEITFENRLPQPSTIHWHGLPVPPDQDGNPSAPVPSGATRVYRFTLPPGSAGTYWYHPHPHMLTAEQVFRGLAGPFIVRAADDPLAAWPERHLFVTDLKLAADGTIADNGMMDWMNGREGQFVLVNGGLRPQWQVSTGERWRVWNACSARFLKLTLGAGRPFVLVGTDGGLLEAPREGIGALLLAPGERAELLVRPGEGGAQSAQLVAARYDRRKMAMSHGSLAPEPDRVLGEIRFVPGAAAPRDIPAQLRPIAPLGAPAAQKTVVFSEAMDMHAMHQSGAALTVAGSTQTRPRGMAFMVNGALFEPGRATLTSRRGEVEQWTIENGTDMDHPFHLHGTQFQVTGRETGGVVSGEPWLAWRDTVNVRPGEKVHILTQQPMAGERMFHCHILEHEDMGMMGTLRVV